MSEDNGCVARIAEIAGERGLCVVTAGCVTQMAQGALRLLSADVAVACTGVGGPDMSEGRQPGTVFVAVATEKEVTVRELALDGSPEEVLAATATECLVLLEEVLDKL